VYTGLNKRQPIGRNIYEMVGAMGIKAVKIETTDVIHCLNQTTEVINKARSAKQPVFIEYSTYRWLEHCGPNDDDLLGYRPAGELSKWKSEDPISKLENILVSSYGVSSSSIKEIQNKISEEVSLAFNQAKKDEFPTLEQSVTDVYAR
jgi:pyruvate dehydrogenase E1 component alpha subunit